MANSEFEIGQRVYVSSLNPKHSVYKQRLFLGRVVTVINVREQKNGFRYFVRLAIDSRYTMFVLEKHLEHLSNQELNARDKANFQVNYASEIPIFEEKPLLLTEKQLLWKAYMTLDHGNPDERLSMLENLKRYFEKVGKPTKGKIKK
ncbi:hypothetical protein [Photobacterium damselae]|uniref:hypothetical protein n=1 Tax=Photobacterium damselae TaxID=38293 RepID=UPI0010FD8C07|nr:hypothetical protein [Photobacterium damselae]TLS74855.1 hypothetical protein FD721_17580 [Photobacterium damselae subsp. damselae]TLS89941.1 hypothetical protein FD720_00790 [Photobacterium damselae subsp. damselae]